MNNIPKDKIQEILETLPPEKRKELEDQGEILKEALRLAYIGRHFLNFIMSCRMKNVDPLNVAGVSKDSLKKDGIDPSKLPAIAFILWLVEPTEESFKQLSTALNVDFDSIIKSVPKEEKKNGKPKENSKTSGS